MRTMTAAPISTGCPAPLKGVSSGGGQARLDRVDLDLGHCLGVLDREHRDGGFAGAAHVTMMTGAVMVRWGFCAR
jgi:hypothetical protein